MGRRRSRVAASEAAYSERLGRARERFRALAGRARAFRDRLSEIERLVEERDRLSLGVEEERSRREELNGEIGAFYAAWRALVAEARGAAGSLAGLLPAHELDDLRAHLSETAVKRTAEALEAVRQRLEEFAAAAGRRRPRLRDMSEVPGAPSRRGRWVTAAEYAAYAGISAQTLANWRWQDRKAGRGGPAPGRPLYRRFGRSVRYYLPEQG